MLLDLSNIITQSYYVIDNYSVNRCLICFVLNYRVWALPILSIYHSNKLPETRMGGAKLFHIM